jgi:hypothetical protein
MLAVEKAQLVTKIEIAPVEAAPGGHVSKVAFGICALPPQ